MKTVKSGSSVTVKIKNLARITLAMPVGTVSAVLDGNPVITNHTGLRTFGPYQTGGKLVITATGGDASYSLGTARASVLPPVVNEGYLYTVDGKLLDTFENTTGPTTGTSVKSVNGVFPDTSGNVVIAVSTENPGSGTGNPSTGTGFSLNQATGYAEATVGGVKVLAVPADAGGLPTFMKLLNQAPKPEDDADTVTDAQGLLTGNVTANDIDTDGDTFVVSSISYGGITRTVNQPFQAAYGTFSIEGNGFWQYRINDAGNALTTGQSASEVFSYRVTDLRLGVSKVTTLLVTVVGSNQGPILSSDNGIIPVEGSASGNVLSNDYDYENNNLGVILFTYTGNPTPFNAGDVATISGVGTISIQTNGDWTFTTEPGYTGSVPTITYTVSDGTSARSETLNLSIEQPAPTYAETLAWFAQYANGLIVPTNIAPNPPPNRPAPPSIYSTVAGGYVPWNYSLTLPNQSGETGSSLHFRVGPGMEYAELHDVPWNTLLAGDRVHVYPRPEPYKECIAMHQRGTITRWIEIIGMPGPNGELPALSGIDAVEYPQSIYNEYIYGGGGISVRSPAGGSSTYKPAFIHIHGFEFREFGAGHRYTNYEGISGPWGKFASGITCQGFDNLTISGCRFKNNNLGIFGSSNPVWGERLMSRNLHILFNHFESNGVNTPGSDARYETHNAYTEVGCSIYEFNVFDPVAIGNFGDLLKERSSGQIIRYNKFRCGAANAISIRDPEASYPGVLGVQDKYGQVMHNYSYVYGNEIALLDSAITVGHGDGIGSIHGEVRGGGRVYFYNNRVVGRSDNPSGYYEGYEYKPHPFVLFCPLNTRLQTKFYAQNNLFFAEKETPSGLETEMAMFYWQGDGEFNDNIAHKVRPVYVVDGTIPREENKQARGVRSAETLETLNLVNVNTDQKFLDFEGDDFTLLPNAPFYSLGAAHYGDVVQRGLAPQGEPVAYPLNRVPAPVLRIRPAISGSVVVGATLTLTPGLFTPLPDVRAYQWTRDGVYIPNATGLTYQTVVEDIQKQITCMEYATNETETTEVQALGVVIVSQTTPQSVLAPVATGSGQVSFPIDCGTGTWSVVPSSYTYQWKFEDGTPIVGADTNQYIPAIENTGVGVFCTVGGVGASGETGYANSNIIMIIPVDLDPDVNGVFNFAGPNGTILNALDSGWEGTDTVSYGVTNQMFECKDGTLVTNAAYIINSSSPTWYAGKPQNDNQKVKITFDRPISNSVIYLYLESRVGQAGYSVAIGATNVTMNKGGASIWFVASVAHNLPATDCEITMEKIGNVIKVYGQSGETLLTFTDDGSFNGPMYTGGYPGLSCYVPSLANNTYAAIKSFQQILIP